MAGRRSGLRIFGLLRRMNDNYIVARENAKQDNVNGQKNR